MYLSWGYLSIHVTLKEFKFLPASRVAQISLELSLTSKITKADSATATTLMTLLPALLVSAPFWTTRISSLIMFSTSATFLTADTRNLQYDMMTLPKKKIFKVSNLCAETTIQRYGKYNASPC